MGEVALEHNAPDFVAARWVLTTFTDDDAKLSKFILSAISMGVLGMENTSADSPTARRFYEAAMSAPPGVPRIRGIRECHADRE